MARKPIPKKKLTADIRHIRKELAAKGIRTMIVCGRCGKGFSEGVRERADGRWLCDECEANAARIAQRNLDD